MVKCSRMSRAWLVAVSMPAFLDYESFLGFLNLLQQLSHCWKVIYRDTFTTLLKQVETTPHKMQVQNDESKTWIQFSISSQTKFIALKNYLWSESWEKGFDEIMHLGLSVSKSLTLWTLSIWGLLCSDPPTVQEEGLLTRVDWCIHWSMGIAIYH